MLPAASAAEQVTSVEPGANVLPDAGRQVVATLPPTRSAALAGKETTAPAAEVAATEIPIGSCSVGGVVSTTVTAKESWAVSPAPLRAVQSTIVPPSAKRVPDAGRQETGTSPPASVACGIA